MTSFASLLRPAESAAIRTLLRDRLNDWLKLSFRHDLLVARYVRGLQIEAARLFDREVINPLLRATASRLAGLTVRSRDLANDLFPGMVALRSEIEQVVHRGVAAIRQSTEAHMRDLARDEVAWVGKATASLVGGNTIDASIGALAVQGVQQRVWLGDTTEKWFEKALDRPTADTARSWITSGVKQGLSVDEITRGLVGTRTQVGVLEKPRHTARALVRTASTQAATVGRMESFKALGLTHWRFVATLDHRTCFAASTRVRLADGTLRPICTLRRGDVVESGSGAPRRVNGIKRAIATDWRVIRFANGDSVECTWNHPFWTDRGWVEAWDLQHGSMVGLRAMQTAVPHGAHAPQAAVLQQEVLRGKQTDDGPVSMRPLRRDGYAAPMPGAALLLKGVLLRNDSGHVLGSDLRGVRTPISCAQGLRGPKSGSGDPLLESVPRIGSAKRPAKIGNTVLMRDVSDSVHAHTSSRQARNATVLLYGVQEEAGDEMVRHVSRRVPRGVDVAEEVLQRGVLQEVKGRDDARSDGPRGDRTSGTRLQAGGPRRPVLDRLRDPFSGARNRSGRVLLAREEPGPRQEEGREDLSDGTRTVPYTCGQGVNRSSACSCHGTEPEAHSFAEVESVVRVDHEAECFDIEVEGDHSFLVASGLIAHNSLICASEDGNVYEIGDGPMPPLHPNCRSVASPSRGPDEEIRGKRASIKGQVDAGTTFEDWLETLPKGEQDRYLGKTKAVAWRAGDLKLKDMIGRDLQPLTLDELRDLDRL